MPAPSSVELIVTLPGPLPTKCTMKLTQLSFRSFFASAWQNTPDSMPHPAREYIYSSYHSQLTQLSIGLPMFFRPTVDNLIARLPELFTDDWPIVPQGPNNRCS